MRTKQHVLRKCTLWGSKVCIKAEVIYRIVANGLYSVERPVSFFAEYSLITHIIISFEVLCSNSVFNAAPRLALKERRGNTIVYLILTSELREVSFKVQHHGCKLCKEGVCYLTGAYRSTWVGGEGGRNFAMDRDVYWGN